METLQQNGFYRANITEDRNRRQRRCAGGRAIHGIPDRRPGSGDVKVQGDPGMTTETFRKKGRLKQGSRVNSRHGAPRPDESEKALPEAAASGGQRRT